MLIVALVKDGKLIFQQDGRANLDKKLAKLEGEYVKVEVKSLTGKTHAQLKYYYGVVLPAILKELENLGWDDDGKPHTIESADKLVKQICAKFDGITVTDKSEMSIEECQVFLDTVIKWATTKLHAYIPEPTKE